MLGKHLLMQLLGHLEAALALVAVTGVMLMVTDGKGQVPPHPPHPLIIKDSITFFRPMLGQSFS